MRKSYNLDDILDFIERFTKQRGYPPTRRDIMSGCGVTSSSTVQALLERLEKRGSIVCDPGTARGIQVVDVEPQP